VIPATCPCCEVLHPPHCDGCTFDDDCPNEAAIFDEMSALRAEIAKLREERRWISVVERLPADSVAVLCCGDGIGAEMVWRENGQWHLSWVGTPISDSTYTHWQPLPPGPETKEVGRE